MEEEEKGPEEERMVVLDLETKRGENNDEENTMRGMGVVTVEVCSVGGCLGSEPCGGRRESKRKEEERAAEIRDFLSSYSQKDDCVEEEESRKKTS
jgi:hypothetical protein